MLTEGSGRGKKYVLTWHAAAHRNQLRKDVRVWCCMQRCSVTSIRCPARVWESRTHRHIEAARSFSRQSISTIHTPDGRGAMPSIAGSAADALDPVVFDADGP